MAAAGAKNKEEVDRLNETEERTPLTKDEQMYLKAGLDALGTDADMFTQVDALQIVRGYQTYEPRLDETVKAFKTIRDWRRTVKWNQLFDEVTPAAEKFHGYWKEKVYGVDKYGHTLITFTFVDIKTDDLAADFDEAALNTLAGQKYAAYAWHKLKLQQQTGTMRYKHTFIIDMKAAGMAVLGSKKRNEIKRFMDIGANFFPDSVWKLYIINTPFMLRGGWAIARPFVHPVTQAKVNIHKSHDAAIKKMMEVDGYTLDALPDVYGGTHKGVDMVDICKQACADIGPKGGPCKVDRTAAQCLANPSGKFGDDAPTTAATADSGGDAPASGDPKGTLL